MTSQDKHPDHRSFLEGLAGAFGGFVREYRAGLGEPSRQEIAAIEAEVSILNDVVQSLAQATDRNQQAVLDALQRIADQMEQVDTRLTALEQAGQPEQTARWRALLKRLGELALLLVGPTALAAALRDAFVQDELYPVLRDRLLGLLTHTENLVGPLEAAQSAAPLSCPGPLTFDWVEIPAGPFLMGSDPPTGPTARPDEQPQHMVYLPIFWISRTPVTNHQFARFVQATGYMAKYWIDFYTPICASTHAAHPVTWVTYNDALAFCRWAHVRLPTEAEWEKAARGTDGRLYPWGNQPPNAQQCNIFNHLSHTVPVGSYPAGASPYGVLDMAGNVWEWCSDWYDWEVYRVRAFSETRNPSGPVSAHFRVMRGGCYYSDDYAVRCASRHRNLPDSGMVNDTGFRVAKSSLP